jgi:hypothetical protein
MLADVDIAEALSVLSRSLSGPRREDFISEDGARPSFFHLISMTFFLPRLLVSQSHTLDFAPQFPSETA